jgi:luciferase family oxidoreductase group 1
MLDTIMPIPFSVLDLAPIVVGGTVSQALRNSLDLAQLAEQLGYHRYWVAEHHNARGIASSATSVLIGYLAAGTSTIRVGSGGVMLPNHPPLVIAEQFGTLEELYPGRIDLGIGRAPGTDPLTVRALRREALSASMFPQDVEELRGYFRPATPAQAVQAVPGVGLKVPLWLLGSSDFSARFAAYQGLPFAFASHFAPDYLYLALEIYRNNFRPSEQLDRPHVMVGANVIAADTDAEARRLFTTLQQRFLAMRRGSPGPLDPPIDSMDGLWSEAEAEGVGRALSCSGVGSRDTVSQWLSDFIRETAADEVIITTPIYDHQARRRSLEITVGARAAL